MLMRRPGSSQLPRGLITGQGLLQLQKTPQPVGPPHPRNPGISPQHAATLAWTWPAVSWAQRGGNGW